jgi:hypothetical protein
MSEEKNRIAPPVNATIPIFDFNGLRIAVIMDMVASTGFLQIIEGDNPMQIATPSVQVAKGVLVCVVPAEIAEKIRPMLREGERRYQKAIADGLVSMPIGPDLRTQ